MSEYKKYYLEASKKPKIAGYTTDGPDAPPSNLLPPDRTNVKESYTISNVIDLISEGPIEGLVDRDGRTLYGQADDFVNVEPQDENIISTTPAADAYILKDFPDKILNTSYTRNTNLKARPPKQRARYPYHMLIVIDLSTGAAPYLDQIKEKLGKVVESQSLIKSLGFQLIFTVIAVGGRGEVLGTETIVTISSGSTQRIYNEVFVYTQFKTITDQNINAAQVKNRIDSQSTQTDNNFQNMAPVYQAIKNEVERFIERQDEEISDETTYERYQRNTVTAYNAVTIITHQGDRGSRRKNTLLAKIKNFQETLRSLAPTNEFSPSRYGELDADEDFLNNFKAFVIDLGDGEATTSYQPLIDTIGGKAFDSTSTIYDVFSYIGEFLLQTSTADFGLTYRAFEGLKNQLTNAEIPQLIYDGGTKYLITDLGATKVYYTSTQGFQGPWIQQEASGPAGQVISAKTLTLDKGVYFDENQVKTDSGKQFAKYQIELKKGSEDQTISQILPVAKRTLAKQYVLLGPFDRTINGARNGTGSRDERRSNSDRQGSGRDFTAWQNYEPAQKDPSIFSHEIFDADIEEIDIEVSVSALSDTQSFNSSADNKAGRSKAGRPLPTKIDYVLKTKHILKSGEVIEELATFKIPKTDGKGFNIRKGKIALTGIILQGGYRFTISNIVLPEFTSETATRLVTLEKTTFETKSNLINRDTSVASVTEKTKNRFRYPMSAYIGSSVDARSFQKLPNRTFKIKGKKILVPSNYFPTDDLGGDRRFSSDGSTVGNRIYDGEWDGSFRWAWSDNPAWVLYDLLNNFRYGTALYSRDLENIDIWSLYEIGKYCDAVDEYGKFVGVDDGLGGKEPRFSFNQRVEGNEDAYSVLKNIAKHMQALCYYKDSQIQFRIDKPEPVSMTFTNLNVVDGLFSYSDVVKGTKLTSVEVNYLDKENNYRPRTEYAEDKESISKYGYIKEYVNGYGVTSKGQALRMARNILFDSQHATETVSFDAGFESSLLSPGDIIRVVDEMKNLVPNYGMFLQSTGFLEYPNGAYGVTGLIVDRQIAPQTGLILTGSDAGNETYIHLFNANLSKGIKDLYFKKSLEKDNKALAFTDEEISGLRTPVAVSLQLSTEEYPIQDLGDNGILFKLETTQDYPPEAAFFQSMTPFAVDVSGRIEKTYRVLSVREKEEGTYGVGAVTYHTGKFDFVENNVKFDPKLDNFDVSTQKFVASLPKPPSAITPHLSSIEPFSGTNSIGAIDFPISIVNSNPSTADRFQVNLTKPDGTIVSFSDRVLRTGVTVAEGNTDDNGSTMFTFTGDAVNQAGLYTVNVFSETFKFYEGRSTTSRAGTFTVALGNLGLDDAGAVVRYSGISGTDENVFFNSFGPNDIDIDPSLADTAGSRTFKSNPESSAIDLNLIIRDFIGQDITNSPELRQFIDFKDAEPASGRFDLDRIDETGREGVTEFRLEKNELHERLDVPIEVFESGFDYEVENKMALDNSFAVENGKFHTDRNSGAQNIIFESGSFRSTPAVFLQQVYESGVNYAGNVSTIDHYETKPASIIETSGAGFTITSTATSTQVYEYFAFETGNYRINTQRFKIGFFDLTGTGFEPVSFNDSFTGTDGEGVGETPDGPMTFVQLQSGISGIPTASILKTTSKTGFFVRAESIYDIPMTGTCAYLAIENRLQSGNNFNFTGIGSDVNISGDTGVNPHISGVQQVNYFDFGSGTFNYTANKDYAIPSGDRIPYETEKFAAGDERVNFLVQPQHSQFGFHQLQDGESAVVIRGKEGDANYGERLLRNPITAINVNGQKADNSTDGEHGKIKYYTTANSSSNLDFASFGLFGWFNIPSGSNAKGVFMDSWNIGGFIWGHDGGDIKLYVGYANSTDNLNTVASNLDDGKLHSIFINVASDGFVQAFIDGTGKQARQTINTYNTGVSTQPGASLNNFVGASFLGPQGDGGNHYVGFPDFTNPFVNAGISGSFTGGYAANYMGIKTGSTFSEDQILELNRNPNLIKSAQGLNDIRVIVELTGNAAHTSSSSSVSQSGTINSSTERSRPVNYAHGLYVDQTTGIFGRSIFALGGGDSMPFNYRNKLIANQSPFRNALQLEMFVGDTQQYADFESGQHLDTLFFPEGKVESFQFSGIEAALKDNVLLENEAKIRLAFANYAPIVASYPTGVGGASYDLFGDTQPYLEWQQYTKNGGFDDPRDWGTVKLDPYENLNGRFNYDPFVEVTGIRFTGAGYHNDGEETQGLYLDSTTSANIGTNDFSVFCWLYPGERKGLSSDGIDGQSEVLIYNWGGDASLEYTRDEIDSSPLIPGLHSGAGFILFHNVEDRKVHLYAGTGIIIDYESDARNTVDLFTDDELPDTLNFIAASVDASNGTVKRWLNGVRYSDLSVKAYTSAPSGLSNFHYPTFLAPNHSAASAYNGEFDDGIGNPFSDLQDDYEHFVFGSDLLGSEPHKRFVSNYMGFKIGQFSNADIEKYNKEPNLIEELKGQGNTKAFLTFTGGTGYITGGHTIPANNIKFSGNPEDDNNIGSETGYGSNTSGSGGFLLGYQNIDLVKFFTGAESDFDFNPFTEFNFAFEKEVNLKEHYYDSVTGEIVDQYDITADDINNFTGLLFYKAVPYNKYGPMLTFETGELTSHKTLENKFGSFNVVEETFSGRMFTGFTGYNFNLSEELGANLGGSNLNIPVTKNEISGVELSSFGFDSRRFTTSHTSNIVNFVINTGTLEFPTNSFQFEILSESAGQVRVRSDNGASIIKDSPTDGSPGAVSNDLGGGKSTNLTYSSTSKQVTLRTSSF